jgi:hypothetical protein
MGALSNSGRKAANLAGFYKGIQSAGAAIFWRLDSLKKPYNTMFGATVSALGRPLCVRRQMSRIDVLTFVFSIAVGPSRSFPRHRRSRYLAQDPGHGYSGGGSEV